MFTAKELADVIENEEPTYLPANSLNYSLNNVDPWTANAIKYCDAHWTSVFDFIFQFLIKKTFEFNFLQRKHFVCKFKAYTTPDYPGSIFF